MSFKRYVYTAIFCAVLILTMHTGVDAAYLYLEPETQTIAPGDTFELTLGINTEGERPTTSDALILYNPEFFEYVSVIEVPENEAFFSEVYERPRQDKVYIGAAIRLGSDPSSGAGPITKLRFKALKDVQTNISFACTEGSTTDSNISLKKNSRVTDIINCDAVQDATIIVSSGGTVPTPYPTTAPFSTPTPYISDIIGGGDVSPTVTVPPTVQPTVVVEATPTPEGTLTPTPSVLPETGIVETASIIVGLGLALVVVSLVVKIWIL